MEFVSLNGGGEGEYSDMSLVEIFETFAIQDDIS